MHMRALSVINLDSITAMSGRRVVDLQGDLENLADISSVTRQILQQSPFSTAC
jgi:hypothetical protein